MKVRPLRSSLKPMCEFIKKFKKYIQADFVEAMNNTPFGPIFMAFYNEQFGAEKGLKSKAKTSIPCKTIVEIVCFHIRQELFPYKLI